MIEESYFQKECLTIRWSGECHNLEKVSIFLFEVYFDYSTSCLHAFFKFQPIFPTPTSKKDRKEKQLQNQNNILIVIGFYVLVTS